MESCGSQVDGVVSALKVTAQPLTDDNKPKVILGLLVPFLHLPTLMELHPFILADLPRPAVTLPVSTHKLPGLHPLGVVGRSAAPTPRHRNSPLQHAVSLA